MNTQIKRAVALALTAGIASGAAQAASLFDQAVSAGNIVVSSGSTAVSATLTNYFEQALATQFNPCAVSGTGSTSQLEVYADSASGQQFSAFACMSNTSVITSHSTSVPIAFIKELNGGSANGIVYEGITTPTLAYPQLTTMTSACGTGTTKPATTATVNGTAGVVVGVPYTSFTCSGETVVSLAPNLGFADVDTPLFGKSAGSFGVTVGATIDLIFAPAVSLGLYHALQQAEGLTQDDTLANMPSLTKAEIASIFTGQIPDWAFMSGKTAGDTLGSVAVSYGNSAPGLGAFEGTTQVPALTSVYICRRDDYSGTEKTNESFFGGQAQQGGSCLLNVNPWVGSSNAELFGSGWANSDTSVQVFANASTGNVLKCLEAHDSVGHFAIGYASVDNAWGTNGTPQQSSLAADWRYIKIDNVVPSIENAAAGRYPPFAQSIYTIPANTSAANSLKAAGANANALSLQNAMTGTHGLGYFVVVEAVNALDQWSAPNFHGGVLAIPSGASGAGPNAPVDASASNATFFSNPVNIFYRTVGGVDTGPNPANINNCQQPAAALFNDGNNFPINGGAAFVPPGN